MHITCSVYRRVVLLYNNYWQQNTALLVVFTDPCERDRFDSAVVYGFIVHHCYVNAA